MKRGSRRAPGEGTYEQLPSGLWRLVVKRDKKKITGPAKETKAEARAALNAKLVEGRTAKSQSFSSQARSYLKSRKLSPTTLDTYGFWTAALEADPLGKMPVLDVSDADLRKWAARQKLEPVTIQKRLGFLKSILKDAGNPLTFTVKKTAHERRPLSPRERAVLLDRLTSAEPWLRTALLLAWQCGLRRSEICGLAHEDRDGDGFWVRRVAVLAGGKVIVRVKAKTARSRGWVPLPASLIEVVGSGRGFVIGDGRTPCRPRALSDAISALFKGTILERVPHFGAHALRRTYGMDLLESGADVVTAAKAMRHDPSMLLSEYARSREDLLREAVKRAFPKTEDPPEAPRELPA